MVPFTSFEDMTGETELAAILEEMYGDIEAVEYYVGEFSKSTLSDFNQLRMKIFMC